MSNYEIFNSSHVSNKDTKILVTKSFLILEDKNNIEMIKLEKLNLNELNKINKLDINNNPLILENLKIEYDNRGDPYISGVRLSINETSVFLDKCDIQCFVNCIKKYLNNN